MSPRLRRAQTRLAVVIETLVKHEGTARAVQRAAGLDEGHFSHMRRNRIPGPDVLIRLCRAYPKHARALFVAWRDDRLAAEMAEVDAVRDELEL